MSTKHTKKTAAWLVAGVTALAASCVGAPGTEESTASLSTQVTGSGSTWCEGQWLAQQQAHASYAQEWQRLGCMGAPDSPPAECVGSEAGCPDGGLAWWCTVTGSCEAGCNDWGGCRAGEVCVSGTCVVPEADWGAP